MSITAGSPSIGLVKLVFVIPSVVSIGGASLFKKSLTLDGAAAVLVNGSKLPELKAA